MAINTENRNNEMRCSFCGKLNSQVKKLVAGPDGVFICDECVEICQQVIKENSKNNERI